MMMAVFGIEGRLALATETRGDGIPGSTYMIYPSFSTRPTKRRRRIRSRLFPPREVARAQRITLSFSRPFVHSDSHPP